MLLNYIFNIFLIFFFLLFFFFIAFSADTTLDQVFTKSVTSDYFRANPPGSSGGLLSSLCHPSQTGWGYPRGMLRGPGGNKIKAFFLRRDFHLDNLRCHLQNKVNIIWSRLLDCSPPGSSVHGSFQTRVGSHSLLLGIFPTQGSSPSLLRCRKILYQLSHRGSPSS